MSWLSDAPRRKVLVVLPEPVDDRLESLTRLARAAQVQASRSQMIAALIASAPTAPGRLARVVRDYLAQDEQVFAQEHPEAGLPEIQHPGAKRGSAHWSRRRQGQHPG